MQKPTLEEVIEHAIADALRPYTPDIPNGPNAHLWIARRAADEVARVVRKHVLP